MIRKVVNGREYDAYEISGPELRRLIAAASARGIQVTGTAPILHQPPVKRSPKKGKGR
jgi:hypothetical protein